MVKRSSVLLLCIQNFFVFFEFKLTLLPFCLKIIHFCACKTCVLYLCTMKLFLFMYQIKCSVFTFLKMIHVVFIIYLCRNICTDLVLISSFYSEKKDVVIMSKCNTELHTNSQWPQNAMCKHSVASHSC